MKHAFNPGMASDDAFDSGALFHVVVGNHGRLLDPRRTPVTVTAIDLETGHFTVRLDDFEDRGATWDMPLESVNRFQFEKSAEHAAASDLTSFEAAVLRFDRPLKVACDPAVRADSLARIAGRRADAAGWLGRRAGLAVRLLGFDPARVGSAGAFAAECEAHLSECGVGDLDVVIAARYVSNPRSGEMVKGHRIVCAELGLVPYDGRIVRSARLFDAPWTRARRAEHIECRAAFVQALFAAAGLSHVELFRGIASQGPPTPPRNETFVSATFDESVARSMMGAIDSSRTGVLLRQRVPIERLFMSCIETVAMNRVFQEAEAVLFWEAGNPLF